MRAKKRPAGQNAKSRLLNLRVPHELHERLSILNEQYPSFGSVHRLAVLALERGTSLVERTPTALLRSLSDPSDLEIVRKSFHEREATFQKESSDTGLIHESTRKKPRVITTGLSSDDNEVLTGLQQAPEECGHFTLDEAERILEKVEGRVGAQLQRLRESLRKRREELGPKRPLIESVAGDLSALGEDQPPKSYKPRASRP